MTRRSPSPPPSVELGLQPENSREDTARYLKHRAGRAALMLIGRGFVVKAITMLGILVLANLLTPHDFGLVALGTVGVALGKMLADAGLGASLIRRAEPPNPAELGVVLGFGLALSAVAVALIAVAASFLGRPGQVALLMSCAVPFAALRSPGVIICERRLEYSPLVTSEIGQYLIYDVWAIGAVIAGFGVWGLASATVIGELAASALVVARVPGSLQRPLLRWNTVKPMLSFSLKFQAVSMAGLIRDQGLNIGTGIIAGVSTLGLWSLAYRIMQVPVQMLEALWRVSFPAVARLIEAGDDVGPSLQRSAAVLAAMTSFFLAILAGVASPMVGLAFGSKWLDAADAIPPAALGVAVMGPVSVASAGYLYAKGHAGTVLRGAILHTVAWLGVSFALLNALGVLALGLGWLAAGLVEALVLGLPASRSSGARLFRVTLPPCALGTLSVIVGGLLAPNDSSVSAVLIGAVSIGTLQAALLFTFARDSLRDGVAVARSLRTRATKPVPSEVGSAPAL